MLAQPKLSRAQLLAEQGSLLFLRSYGTRGLYTFIFDQHSYLRSLGSVRIFARVKLVDLDVLDSLEKAMKFYDLAQPVTWPDQELLEYYAERLVQLSRLSKFKLQRKLEQFDYHHPLAELYDALVQICKEPNVQRAKRERPDVVPPVMQNRKQAEPVDSPSFEFSSNISPKDMRMLWDAFLPMCDDIDESQTAIWSVEETRNNGMLARFYNDSDAEEEDEDEAPMPLKKRK